MFALLAHFLETLVDRLRAVGEDALVEFDLRFAGAPQADAAFLPVEVSPAAHQPRLRVPQLRQLHLQLTFVRSRTRAEDIEDQFGARHHAALQFLFDVALLRRRQIVVDHDQIRRMFRQQRAQLLQFAGADEQARVGTFAARDQNRELLDVGGAHQFFELGDLLLLFELEKTARARAPRAVRIRVCQKTTSLSLRSAMPPRVSIEIRHR